MRLAPADPCDRPTAQRPYQPYSEARETTMSTIKQEDFIQSIADAFQYISYYHPLDYIKALGEAYKRE